MSGGEVEPCALIAPQSAEDWHAYHDIRRRILFENRGEYGIYDPNRPDERAPGHFPRLLKRASANVGVVRIDVADGTAYLRRVAIDEPYQRQGVGRTLLALAEAFARAQSATRVESAVAPDACRSISSAAIDSSPPRRPAPHIRGCARISGVEGRGLELGFCDVGHDRVVVDRQRPALALELV